MNAIWYTLKWWMMKNRGPPLTVWSQGSELVFISQIRLWPSSIFPFARIVLIHKNMCWYLVYILVQLLLFSSQFYILFDIYWLKFCVFFLASPTHELDTSSEKRRAALRLSSHQVHAAIPWEASLPRCGKRTSETEKRDWETERKLWLFDGLELFYFMTFHSGWK